MSRINSTLKSRDKSSKDTPLNKSRDLFSPQSYNADSIDIRQKKKLKNSLFSSSPYALNNSVSLKVIDKSKKKYSISIRKQNIKPIQNLKKNNFCLDSTKNLNSFYLNKSNEESDDEYKDYRHTLLRKIEKGGEMGKKFEVCKEVLVELIEKEKNFGYVLSIIKREYDNAITYNELENDTLRKDLRKEENIKTKLSYELKKFIKQYKELNEDYEKLQQSYEEISSKLTRITTLDISSISKTDENWEKVIEENRLFEETLYSVAEELEYYKTTYKKMKKIVKAYEKQGFSIKEMHKSINSTKRKKKITKYEWDEVTPDNTEYENIMSGKINNKER
ncbi:hypothetical protein SteCoe_34538 [Stentor coeruleus]|uniref:Translin-associated factor X-interacting protein 1 N-terminal domain-containing protein n=1 Tax=Stentor coeruleus TaxID=5963 RepID=A0A1R2AU95_9CILI|nr:hypothetical protein SteCoe_34538 [Stentor coeruleus]